LINFKSGELSSAIITSFAYYAGAYELELSTDVRNDLIYCLD